MTAERCEPPEGLRERDGWHWLSHEFHQTRPAWWISKASIWANGIELLPIDIALSKGWRYVAPCLTPSEVAALAANWDAAIRALDMIAGGFIDPSYVTPPDWHSAFQHLQSIANSALAAYRAASPEAKP